MNSRYEKCQKRRWKEVCESIFKVDDDCIISNNYRAVYAIPVPEAGEGRFMICSQYPEYESFFMFRKRIMFDEDAARFIDVQKMARFLYNYIDINALCCVDKIYFSYFSDFEEDKNFTKIAEKFENPLACFEHGVDRTLGSCHSATSEKDCRACMREGRKEFDECLNCLRERHTTLVIINLRAIEEQCREQEDFTFAFMDTLIKTVLHEFRHAVCNHNLVAPNDVEYQRFLNFTDDEKLRVAMERDADDYATLEYLVLTSNKKSHVSMVRLVKPMVVREKGLGYFRKYVKNSKKDIFHKVMHEALLNGHIVETNLIAQAWRDNI